MPQPEPNLWIGVYVFSGAVASFATWIFLIQRRTRGPILEYQPRRPVPWGPLATLEAILLVVVTIAMLGRSPEWMLSEFTTTADVVHQIVMGMLQMLLLTAVFFVIVVSLSGATLRDLGLPEYTDQLGRDIGIGAVACLAALVPVFAVQTVMINVVGEPSQHPLVQMVLRDRHPAVLALSFVAAVVVAPICEETAFRLFLQGWLEKWEDRAVTPQVLDAASEDSEAGETRSQGDEESIEADSSPCPPVPLSPCPESSPPSRGIFGLPYGWVPILISSVMFSMAHLGHGSDPVPLFLLAIILGYTYQRTHRIVPCIVTHMLFNLTTLIALGLTIYAS